MYNLYSLYNLYCAPSSLPPGALSQGVEGVREGQATQMLTRRAEVDARIAETMK